jgi:hypothetical protein
MPGRFDRRRICIWTIAFVLIATGISSLMAVMSAAPSSATDNLVTQATKVLYLPDSLGLIAGIGLILRNRIAYWLAVVITTFALMSFGSAAVWILTRPPLALAVAVAAVILLASISFAKRWPTTVASAQWTLISLGAISIVASQQPFMLGGLMPHSSSMVAWTIEVSAVGVYLLWSYRFLRSRDTLAEYSVT